MYTAMSMDWIFLWVELEKLKICSGDELSCISFMVLFYDTRVLIQ